jgi:hypothetical protein
MQVERTGAIHSSVADDAARQITTELYRYVRPGVVDMQIVLEMYDWVRQSHFGAGETIDIVALARKWESRPGNADLEWLTRAFD